MNRTSRIFGTLAEENGGSGGASSCAGTLYQDFCGVCAESQCCAELSACEDDDACGACLGGDSSQCSGTVLTKLNSCLDSKCAKECQPAADCGATQTKPSNGSCGSSYECNPIPGINVGGASKECASGAACDVGQDGYVCYPPPPANDVKLCGACDINNDGSPYCSDGLTCIDNKCTRFCCDDGDCSANGRCDHAPGDVGTCVAK